MGCPQVTETKKNNQIESVSSYKFNESIINLRYINLSRPLGLSLIRHRFKNVHYYENLYQTTSNTQTTDDENIFLFSFLYCSFFLYILHHPLARIMCRCARQRRG